MVCRRIVNGTKPIVLLEDLVTRRNRFEARFQTFFAAQKFLNNGSACLLTSIESVTIISSRSEVGWKNNILEPAVGESAKEDRGGLAGDCSLLHCICVPESARA